MRMPGRWIRRYCLALFMLAVALGGQAAGCAGPDAKGAGASANYAGLVYFVTGAATAQQPGEAARALYKGSAICQGDLLAAGGGATVQLQMADHGTLVLKPNSELRLDIFARPDASDGSEHFLASLLKGGLRAVTGLIGKSHRDNYVIQTTTATIGIRGTDHEVFHVPADQLSAERAAEAGTYDRVISGATYLRTGGGEIQLNPNQVGFAPISGASPVLIKALPSFLSSMPRGFKAATMAKREGAGKSASAASESAQGSENSAAESAAPGGEPSGTGEANASTQAQAASTGSGAVTAVAVSGAGTASSVNVPVNATAGGQSISLTGGTQTAAVTALPNSVYVGAQLLAGSTLDFGAGSVVTGGSDGVVMLNPATSYPVSVAAQNFSYQSQGGQLIQYGTGTIDGVSAYWGIYQGGTTSSGTGTPSQAVDLHHFVFGQGGLALPSVIANVRGSVVYDQVLGGTTPTAQDASQVGGTLKSLSVGVNLGANPGVTSYAVTADDMLNRVWNGSYSGFATLSQFADKGIPLAVTCAGNGCGSGAGQGKAVGVVIGDTASGLLTSYGLSTTTGQGLVGTAALYNGSQTVTSPNNSGYVVAQTIVDNTGQTRLQLGSGVTSPGAFVVTDLSSGHPLLVSDQPQGVLVDLHGSKLLSSGSATVDGAFVEWGLYYGGNSTSSDYPYLAPIGLHHYLYSPGGVTPPAVIASMSGTATYSNILGATPPTDELGQAGGMVHSASVSVNLGANPGVTSYTISLTDAQARNWTGSFQGFASLGDFGDGKVYLTTSCSGNNCGGGPGFGKAGGLLVGNTAGGLATSYGLKMPSGQGVYGAVLVGRH